MRSLAQLQSDLARGGKSRNLVEQCLARIADQSGEGRRAFLKVHAEEALAAPDGWGFAAPGTDPGASSRSRAALCGMVGFNPTAYRVPPAGAFPLSTPLVPVGPLAAPVACCAALDSVLAGDPVIDLPPF